MEAYGGDNSPSGGRRRCTGEEAVDNCERKRGERSGRKEGGAGAEIATGVVVGSSGGVPVWWVAEDWVLGPGRVAGRRATLSVRTENRVQLFKKKKNDATRFYLLCALFEFHACA